MAGVAGVGYGIYALTKKKSSGSGKPAITITNPGASVKQGSELAFSFSGFTPNAIVTYYVEQTDKGGEVTANSVGASGIDYGFIDDDSKGSYVLGAIDSSGLSAATPFTVD